MAPARYSKAGSEMPRVPTRPGLRPRVGELVDYSSEWDRAPSVRRLERGRDGIIRRLVESDRDGRTQDGPRNVEGPIPRPRRFRAPQEVAYGGQTYRFSGWTGDVTSSATEVSVTVNGPLVVHANWATVGILGSPTVTYSLIVVIVVIAIVIALVVARSRRRGE